MQMRPLFFGQQAVYLLTLLLALFAGAPGCGPTEAPKPTVQFDRDRIAAALPKGVTMESAVSPNGLYGGSSKTVEEALRYLAANTRGDVLYDAIGHEIRFETGKKDQPKTVKKKGGGPGITTIVLPPKG